MSRVPIRLPKSKRPIEREADIQKTILEGLSALRIWHMRTNSGTMFGEHAGKKWAVRFGKRGMADILALKVVGLCQSCEGTLEPGACGEMYHFQAPWPYWIEVKRPGGKQTVDQLVFEAEVRQAGHMYILATSWESVLQVLKST